MSLIVKVGKAGKRVVKKFLPEEKHHVSYTRRIERVKTRERVVAMTFDDGPMDLPSSPDKFDGKALTDILLDTLGEYGAQGTFDVVGDTSENYPDTAGKSGQADWGGVRYDHYPDINQDERGGAVHNQRLLCRMLDEGHQVTNHGYRHVLFGKKPFVYGIRDHFHGLDQVVSDLTRLHTLLKETYGYEMTMARPPHYVDKIEGGFTSYDAYDQMGYLYLAAAFDRALAGCAAARPRRACGRRWRPWWTPCGRCWRRTPTGWPVKSFSRKTATTCAAGPRWPLA